MKIISADLNEIDGILDQYLKRQGEVISSADEVVEEILYDVQKKGDEALKAYTAKFDGVQLDCIQVLSGEIEEAVNFVEKEFLEILEEAKKNILDYHMRQKQNSWMTHKDDGIILGQMVTPIERVGIYVPGGKAAYPSSVLMNAIPAQVAGVPSIAMVTPPGKDGKIHPYILAAAYVCGITEIYKVGGAQSIGALAFGTQTIPPVCKIVGPGNMYVARAKRKVFGMVDIDMIAGPSEICIVADEDADPRFVAADLLSQGEHDEEASSILITTSVALGKKVMEEISRQMACLDRRDIMKKSIEDRGLIFIVSDMDAAIQLANKIAPEHLEIMAENPFLMLPKIKNAGAIFLGNYTPEPLGDYFAGPNHTLPTQGTARFSSPLGVDDFMKKSSIIYYHKNALEKVQEKVIYFAEKEGLTAHANSIKVRVER
ncbi:histidinol dehydrogenase [Thermotalea metallivorans]|uniref:Histidinol dehydrogenase n=1 Tax=Thermotalea metallivorans TaxID=520762 RepID=A0A140L9I7_9FIRM|nr:histidinol dehydrogenase [Thermotalea metallivorans]KXG77212.1 Histidinol dehydrogenase [Thermotalea metallivorans]